MGKSERYSVVSSIGEIQRRGYYGLCNAVMAGVPGARFARHWLDLYSSFRSRGRDVLWDEHSVLLPARLATSCKLLSSAVTILPPKRFFPFYWDEARSVMLGYDQRRLRSIRKNSYVVHLWARGAAYGRSTDQIIGFARLENACISSSHKTHVRVPLYNMLACGLLLSNNQTRWLVAGRR